MHNFDSDLFMQKVKKNGCEITACGKNTFELPGFIVRFPDLNVICTYNEENNTIGIKASMPIVANGKNQTISDLCDRLNLITKFHTEIQNDFIVSDIELELSKIAYSDDNEALDYAAIFVPVFQREFDHYAFKTYLYAYTGDIKYLLGY